MPINHHIPGIISILLAVVASEASGKDPVSFMARQIVAHRGSSADRPESTLASIRRAIEVGATAVEVDVRSTKDGQLVILHDDTLDRTTNGKGMLKEFTLSEVRRLDAGSWFDAKYAGEPVPTLKEVLVTCHEKIDVLLDIKEKDEEFAKAVASAIKSKGSSNRTIIGVRSVEQAKLFRHLLPQARQLGLIPEPDAIEPFAEAGVEMIRLWPRWLVDDQALVVRVRRTGATLHLNGTTGSREDVVTLLKHLPDSLSSDDPGRLITTLATLRSESGGK